MAKSIISTGKTTNEAIEKGLKELHVSKNMVDIKVIESGEKRSFFSILTPRVVKVELTVKEKPEKQEKLEKLQNQEKQQSQERQEKQEKIDRIEKNVRAERKTEVIADAKELETAKTQVNEFLQEFFKNIPNTGLNYSVEMNKTKIVVNITGTDSGFLIGYRGETLNSLQNILSSIANKNNNSRIKVVLDVENYREKRKEVLEALAIKVSKTVVKTGKSITLEPMGAYERKIIHTKLQDNKYVSTHSIGEEPNRRIVISKR